MSQRWVDKTGGKTIEVESSLLGVEAQLLRSHASTGLIVWTATPYRSRTVEILGTLSNHPQHLTSGATKARLTSYSVVASTVCNFHQARTRDCCYSAVEKPKRQTTLREIGAHRPRFPSPSLEYRKNIARVVEVNQGPVKLQSQTTLGPRGTLVSLACQDIQQRMHTSKPGALTP